MIAQHATDVLIQWIVLRVSLFPQWKRFWHAFLVEEVLTENCKCFESQVSMLGHRYRTPVFYLECLSNVG
jgi:hypothetical protein